MNTTRHRIDWNFRLSSLELLLLAVIVIGVAFMVRILVSPASGPDHRIQDSIDNLELRVRELTLRVDTLQRKGKGTAQKSNSSASPAIREMMKRIRHLEKRVNELNRRCTHYKKASSVLPSSSRASLACKIPPQKLAGGSL